MDSRGRKVAHLALGVHGTPCRSLGHHQHPRLVRIAGHQGYVARHVLLAQHHAIGPRQERLHVLPLATTHVPVLVPTPQPALGSDAQETIAKCAGQRRGALAGHGSQVDDARFPVGWDHLRHQQVSRAMQHLVPAMGGIGILERGRRSRRSAGHQDSIQHMAQIEVGAGAGDDTDATTQRAGRARSVGYRPADSERTVYQVAGHVTDGQVIQFSDQRGQALSTGHGVVHVVG